jgi:sugar phosphate isomerase/epimerase
VAKLGIEAISVFGLPPVEYVNLAADLDCPFISTGLTAFPYDPHGYGNFSLRDDAALRRTMIAEMKARGVSVSLGEGLTVRPGGDVANYAADLDIFAELGATLINTVSMDPDLARTFDQFGRLAELAGARGLRTSIEFAPGLTIATLRGAIDAVAHVGRPDFGLLIDTMHLVRSGAGAADLVGIDVDRIFHIQLSDAPSVPRFESYFEESMFERVAPGEGGLGLSDIVAALPGDRVYGLEIPLRTEAEAGIGPAERIGRCAAAARQLLQAAGHPIT